MKFYDLIAASAATLCNNRLKATLTILSITIGIATLTVGLGIMEGTNQTVKKTMAGFGRKFMTVYPDWDPVLRRSKGKNFTLEDAQAISGVSGVTMISLQKSNGWAPVTYRNRQLQTDIFGTDPNFLTIRNRKIAKGRFIDDQDIFNNRRVCVITEGIKKRFFPTADYLEQRLEINGMVFQIIGCLEPKLLPAIFDDNSEERSLFIPITTSQNAFHQYDYDSILIRYVKKYEKKQKMKLLKARIESILKFHKGETNEYVLETLDEFTKPQKNMALVITIALCALAALCLLVGGIGIMIIMFGNVMERVREIENRKAVWIRKHEILDRFLGESILISTIGGLAGLLLGIIGARAVAIFAGIPVSITWWVLLSSIGLMLLIGIAFGFYPAKKAASLQPVECFRYE